MNLDKKECTCKICTALESIGLIEDNTDDISNMISEIYGCLSISKEHAQEQIHQTQTTNDILRQILKELRSAGDVEVATLETAIIPPPLTEKDLEKVLKRVFKDLLKRETN